MSEMKIQFIPGQKLFRIKNTTGKVKLIQYGGFYAGKPYPMIVKIGNKYYKNNNSVAPDYSYNLVEAQPIDFRR